MCRPPSQSDAPAQIISGLIWAMPVRIWQLGASLKIYMKCAPAVETLRLCVKFGQGDEVHINKLPVDLLEEVVDQIWAQAHPDSIEDTRAWIDGLSCFRAECSVQNHLRGEYLRKAQIEYFSEHLVLQSGWPENPDKWALYNFIKEKKRWSFNNTYLGAEEKANERENLAEGSFVKYDKLLKDFGLQAMIIHHSVEPETSWNGMLEGTGYDRMYNTTCYLVLPPRLSKECRRDVTAPTTYIPGLVPPHMSGAPDNFLTSSFIDMSSLALREKDKLRFGRVRRVLNLTPYAHLSQLKSTISAHSASFEMDNEISGYMKRPGEIPPLYTRTEREARSQARQDENELHRKKIRETTWPQLLSLTRSNLLFTV
ncbi:uncharacterized protein BDZ99DRAFT_571767 [Mytilinidion resinicola]|uniref:Uncharacterized protein n=1 Tax=Mytilinidion resinicola TaxID=574789 RepID=A0A6A6YJD0_9PEZI|nr:uncharacterized protein BDZ99DRAFT_571767 [Mytilinidion resinicola]KAF2808911.1 hypothetical protein BDZ99DRAFT_571767 [Mytilinidion resinicola]